MIQKANPRILVVTPEVTYLPDGMGNIANSLSAKAGGLADVSAALINALFQLGADVHVALPDYRRMFDAQAAPILGRTLASIRTIMPDDRIHLAEDRNFFYLANVYSNYEGDNAKIALAFQREVINNIIPRVKPDLIHCNDWMTGLVPAFARQLGIPCLFTVHNIHTIKLLLAEIEDRGIDAAFFWQHLYYLRMAYTYERTREYNPVDLLASGIFAAHFVNTVSPSFLLEIVEGRHSFVDAPIRQQLSNKFYADCAVGILNAPDPSFDPAADDDLTQRYSPETVEAGKRANKAALQGDVGLVSNPDAPLFFWPHRLDTVQKGCELLSRILYWMINTYWDDGLQLIFVANGEYKRHFADIVNFHGFSSRVAICDFNEALARRAYAAADFILMPSKFEPCGLPQMIAPIYGAMPVAHNTGGIHDTIRHIDVSAHTGNGFLFDVHDEAGLKWAVSEAMAYYRLPPEIRITETQRIMGEAMDTFTHDVTARRYIDLYERMLQRPLIVSQQ
jgi:starch synthase